MKEVNKSMIWICMFLLVISIVQAELIYQQNKEADLKINCYDTNNAICGASICNISVLYPNSTLLLDNVEMTKQSIFYNYTLKTDQTGIVGDYKANVYCYDGNYSGFNNFDFSITADGTKPTIVQSIIYFGLLIIITVFLILALYWATIVRHPALQTGLYLLGYLLLIYISFIGERIATSYLNSSLLSGFMNIWFKIMMIGLPFVVIYLLIITIVNVVTNKHLLELGKRGLS